MKNTLKFFFAVLFIVAGFRTNVSAAPSFDSGHYDIEILENGNAEITETWVVRFDDERTYSVYYRQYALSDYYEITDWSATIDGSEMEEESTFDDLNPWNTFAAGIKDNEYLIELYQSSYDETRIFTISYTVKNAVKIYEDVADFVWDLTGENEAAMIRDLTARVTVPTGSEPEEFRIWSHGPLNGTFLKEDETTAAFDISSVGASEIVDIRVCVPTYLFSGGYYVAEEKKNDILAYEEGLAEKANAEREELERLREEERLRREEWEKDHPVQAALQDFFTEDYHLGFVVAGIFAGFIGIFIAAAQAKKRDAKIIRTQYTAEQNPPYYRELPDNTPPAVLNTLLSWFPKFEKSKEGNAFSATMLDLFLEGYMDMKRNADGETEIKVYPERTPVRNYENTLISLIIAAASGNASVTLKDIQSYIRKNQSEVAGIIRQFNMEVKAEGMESPYLEEMEIKANGSKSLGRLFTLIGAVFTIYSILAFYYDGAGWASIMIAIFTFLPFFCIAAICEGHDRTEKVLSQSGTDKASLWWAFGKFLDDFSTFEEKELPEVKMWGKYLVYATALGKSKKLIKELALYYPVDNSSLVSDDYYRREMFTEVISSGIMFDTIDSIQSSSYSATSYSDSSGGGGGSSSSDGGSGSGSSGSGFR